MAKLLLSLYLAVFLSIIFINQSSEYIWYQWVESTPDDLRHATKMAKILKDTSATLNEDSEGVILLDKQDIAWFDEQLIELEQGGIVTSYEQNTNIAWLYFLKDKDTLVKLGPFEPPLQTGMKKWLFKLVSFIILALLLVIWIRPLWKDLIELKLLTSELAEGNLNPQTRPAKLSAISSMTSQIRGLARQIADLMQNQKQLVNAVSHELRTPLARLKFALAMLKTSSTQHGEITGMSEDIVEMEQLIEEMLSYARLEFAQESLEPEPVDIADLIMGSVEKIERTSSKSIDVKIQFEPTCMGSRHYLERVFQNLVQNADKYGHSRIEVTLEEDHQYIYCSVDDDGPGIPLPQRACVFEPFTRLDKSRNKTTGGFGLGLAIVNKILSWHKGRIEIDSAPLGGARFKVTLPK